LIVRSGTSSTSIDGSLAEENFEDIYHYASLWPVRPVRCRLRRWSFNINPPQQSLDGTSARSLGETIWRPSDGVTNFSFVVLYRPLGGDIRGGRILIEDVDLNGSCVSELACDWDTHRFSGSIRENLLFVN
jgi:hypothetical protein